MVKKASENSKKEKISIAPEDKKSLKVFLWIVGILVVLGILFFVFDGITGNAIITGRATDTRNAFKPIIDLVAGLIINVYDALEKPLGYLVGEQPSKQISSDVGASMFFGKLLLLMLIFALVSAILKKSGVNFLTNGWVHWTVSLAVSILAIRFVSKELIETVLLPYSTFGVVITAVLPFILYFFFVEKTWGTPNPPIIRRIAWIFFGVVFISLWVLRQEAGKLGEGIVSTIYPLTALLALLMAVFDGTIQNAMNRWNKKRSKAHSNAKLLAMANELQKKLTREYEDVANGVSHAQYVRGQVVGLGYGGSIGAPVSTAAEARKAWDEDMKAIQKYINSIR